MKGYYKVAVFIIVLLASVSMMSSAIDILGDISEVSLDLELKEETTSSVSEGTGDTGKGRRKMVAVEGLPTGTYPLFELRYPPGTTYLRQWVGETYVDGGWEYSEQHNSISYHGEILDLDIAGYESIQPISFTIRPLFNISGFIPATLSVFQIELDVPLERYPSMETFSSPEAFSTTYWVSWAKFSFSEEALRTAVPNRLSYCLEVPDHLYDRLRGLALEIVGDEANSWRRLKAIEQYLQENYAYDGNYTTPDDVDPVENFLFQDKRGVCTHFNSAFILLARSLGLPARAVYGYQINPEASIQFVMSKQAHMYAEVPFNDLGWITFDATPERVEEKPQKVSKIPTITNITGNDPVGIKGDRFNVYGTVNTFNGSAVDGLSVEVFLMISKNETGVVCGRGEVENGFFSISCEASPELEVGDYMLVAHSLSNEMYEESWSDPPIKIIAETEVAINAPRSVYVGDSITLRGRLVDKSNGKPVANMELKMEVGNETFNLVTDSEGRVSLDHVFDSEGNQTVVLKVGDSEYYLGSSGAAGVAVSLPPERQPGILEVLTIFPYNIIFTSVCAVFTASVLFAWSKRNRVALDLLEEEPLSEVLEVDLAFQTYKEGIVKLFNYFFASSRRKYREIEDWMTPREFQGVLESKISRKGLPALDDLVSVFEVANYSEYSLYQKDYEMCRAAVEMISGAIEVG